VVLVVLVVLVVHSKEVLVVLEVLEVLEVHLHPNLQDPRDQLDLLHQWHQWHQYFLICRVFQQYLLGQLRLGFLEYLLFLEDLEVLLHLHNLEYRHQQVLEDQFYLELQEGRLCRECHQCLAFLHNLLFLAVHSLVFLVGLVPRHVRARRVRLEHLSNLEDLVGLHHHNLDFREFLCHLEYQLGQLGLLDQ